MEFFERLSKKASETYKSAAEKTNKIATETKFKIKINDNKSKIHNLYTEIGKKVYQKYALDGNLDIKEDIKKELEKIQELADENLKFEEQILDLSNMRQCIKCKNTIGKDDKFCPVCGTEQPIETVEMKGNTEVVEVVDSDKKEEISEVMEFVVNNKKDEILEDVSENTEQDVSDIVEDNQDDRKDNDEINSNTENNKNNNQE